MKRDLSPFLLRALLFTVCWVTNLPASIEVRGFASLGNDTIVSLSRGKERGMWCRKGDQFQGFTVKEVDLLRNSVTLIDGDGVVTTLTLKGSIIEHAEVPLATSALIDPAKLDWNWIRSDDNPMGRMPEPLPEWVIRAWTTLDETIRTDYRNYYRAHGWELGLVEVSAQGVPRNRIAPLRNPNEPSLTREEIKKRSKPASSVVKLPE